MNTPLMGLPLFGGIGMAEWLVIGAAIVLFFGATKLPKLGKGLGEGIRNFKEGITGKSSESADAIKTSDDTPEESDDSPKTET